MDKKNNENRRKPFRSLAGILLALCLIITMMPIMAFADENTDSEEVTRGDSDKVTWAESVYVLGTQVSSNNCDDVLNDGGSVKYDRDTATITLTDAVLDLKEFNNTSFNETNKVYGISTWQDTSIVLCGTNTIVCSESSFDTGMEYVYGIEAIRGITVSGSGSLSIQIGTADTSSSGILKYLGIESTGKLSVIGTTLSVSMEGSGESCGIQTGWKGFALSEGAEVRAESKGGSNRAVYDSSYKKSTVEYGSSFEMISDSEAFRFSRLPDSVTEGEILVNSEATSDNAYDWDKTTDISTYKYVRLLGSDGGSRASSEVYILGRAINGELPNEVTHSGTISYDSGSKTLTLEDAVIDLDNFKNANGGNLVAGIYATSDIRIALKGDNEIKASGNDYGSGTEYVSGIESWGTVNISGEAGASLSVKLADNNSGNSKKSIVGISADDSILVDTISLDIDMGQYGKCTGIYAWAPLYIDNAANVRVSASGSGNMAVSGPNQIGGSVISGESVLEMCSDEIAFNCWTPKDSLKQIECLVSTSKDGSSAEDWDKKSSLRDFRYVKFTATKGRFGKDVRVLGRKITEENCDDVLGDGTGSVKYDLDSKELTLTNAELDFANFDHEYDHDENPDSGTNMIVGIDADDDITVVLNGRNRIFTTKDTFDEKKEYVYGISSGIMNSMTIMGEGSLDISFDKNNEKLSYTGIDVGDSLNIKGVAVTIDLGGELRGEGIDVMMGAIALEDGATLKVSASGEKSTAVDNQFANNLSIGEGSLFEMVSDGKAFNNYFLSQQVTSGGALVNDEPTAEGAYAWDKKSYLNKYKYVRFPENYEHAHALEHFSEKAASCSETGNIEYWVCWKCGMYFSDEGTTAVDPDAVFIPRKDHDWGDWTYKDNEWHQRVCNYDTEGAHIQTEKHVWDKGKITKPATLLRKGVKTHTCTVCHGKWKEEFSLAGAVKNAARRTAEKIREWIKTLFGCSSDDRIGSKTVTYSIKKAANPLSVSGKTATANYRKLRKKSQTVEASKLMDISGAQGRVTYSLVSVRKAKYKKYFRVNASTGSLSVKKKLRKGTYTLTVNVKAAGNNNYNAASKKIVYKIKVK